MLVGWSESVEVAGEVCGQLHSDVSHLPLQYDHVVFKLRVIGDRSSVQVLKRLVNSVMKLGDLAIGNIQSFSDLLLLGFDHVFQLRHVVLQLLLNGVVLNPDDLKFSGRQVIADAGWQLLKTLVVAQQMHVLDDQLSKLHVHAGLRGLSHCRVTLTNNRDQQVQHDDDERQTCQNVEEVLDLVSDGPKVARVLVAKRPLKHHRQGIAVPCQVLVFYALVIGEDDKGASEGANGEDEQDVEVPHVGQHGDHGLDHVREGSEDAEEVEQLRPQEERAD